MKPGNFSYKQVMLVDDSEIDTLVNRRLMELTHFSENVIVTTTAEEALHFLKEECRDASHTPELIFLDMHLPGMNGYEFLDAFTQLPDFILSKSRIIILSVFQKPEQLQKALQYPFVLKQMDKPLTQHMLREMINESAEKFNVSS